MQATDNDLFTIIQIEHTGGSVQATLAIHPESEILKGHFPDHPVVPGACMLQIVKEALERAFTTVVQLKKADHLKFMCLIDPGKTQQVMLDLSYKIVEEDAISVTAKLVDGEVTCFKLQAVFIKC